MNPTVEAAIIAGGASLISIAGTATVAIVGFRNTRKATTDTIEAGTANTVRALHAARDDRLWDKRTAAYEAALADLLHRQTKRQHELRHYYPDENPEEGLRAFFASYERPGWFESQGRLLAYASDSVRVALEASRQADSEVHARYTGWLDITNQTREAIQSGTPAMAPKGSTAMQARKEVTSGLQEAEAKDNALIKLMREELQSKPELGS